MSVRILIIGILFLSATGCASLKEGFTPRYGLASPENPALGETVADESYAASAVGQQYIEEYDKKYHEKPVLREGSQSSGEEQTQQQEAQ